MSASAPSIVDGAHNSGGAGAGVVSPRRIRGAADRLRRDGRQGMLARCWRALRRCRAAADGHAAPGARARAIRDELASIARMQAAGDGHRRSPIERALATRVVARATRSPSRARSISPATCCATPRRADRVMPSDAVGICSDDARVCAALLSLSFVAACLRSRRAPVARAGSRQLPVVQAVDVGTA